MRAIIFILVSIFAHPLLAKVEMPCIFNNNMVLQQNSMVSFWGKAKMGGRVIVAPTWCKEKFSVKVNNVGEWSLKVKTPLAGGPYTITVSDGEKTVFDNVLIGEVWVCSGQSNMGMPMCGKFSQPVNHSNEYIAKAKNERIRLFTVQTSISTLAESYCGGEWLMCNSASCSQFSATAYFFGLMLQQAMDVPIGLINASVGGSYILTWMSKESLQSFKDISIPLKKKEVKSPTKTPTVYFNGMINPIAGFGIRGVIWYQGEANVAQYPQYSAWLETMVADWRMKWNIGKFPFYFVQIAPFDYAKKNVNVNSAYLREAQLTSSKNIPNSGMAVTLDVGEENCLHPADKKTVGDRLAYLALAKTYGLQGFAYSGPIYREMKRKENAITLFFDNAKNGLCIKGKELTNFEIASENKIFYPAKAIIKGDSIEVYNDNVRIPVAVRYGFKDYVKGDLYNSEGLPASSFRTDSW